MRKARLVVTCAQAPAYEVRIGAGVVNDLGFDLARALDAQLALRGGASAGIAGEGQNAREGQSAREGQRPREGQSARESQCAREGLEGYEGQRVHEDQRTSAARSALLLGACDVPKQFVYQVKQSLAQANFKVRSITVSPDNPLEVAGELWRACAQLSLPEDTVVVAVGDAPMLHLAGFVATAYGSGLACAFVPTTLEAALCLSVSNQAILAVPGACGKVNASMHPLFSCVDLEAFQANAPEQWAAGFSRMVQAAVMDSDEFFFWLSDSAAALRNRNNEALCEALVRTLDFRSRMLSLEEQGELYAKDYLAYGEELMAASRAPLAAGMRFSALLSQLKGIIPEDIVQAQDTLLTQMGCLPPRAVDAAKFTEELLQYAGAAAGERVGGKAVAQVQGASDDAVSAELRSEAAQPSLHSADTAAENDVDNVKAGHGASTLRERISSDKAPSAKLHSEASQPSLRSADGAVAGSCEGNPTDGGCSGSSRSSDADGDNGAGHGAFLVLPTDIGTCRRLFVPTEEIQSCLEVL